jgi:hypothetical protein
MQITKSIDPGQPKMWSIKPSPSMDGTIRVNQLVDTNRTPPVYEPPRLEISIIHLNTSNEIYDFVIALDKAVDIWMEWRKDTEVPVHG